MNKSCNKYITTNGYGTCASESNNCANTSAVNETANTSSCSNSCGCGNSCSCGNNCGCGCGGNNGNGAASSLSGFCPTERCIPVKDTCCKGITPDTDCSIRTGFLPAYVDVIFDKEEAMGCQIGTPSSVSSASCGFSAIYKSCNGCSCATPNIDESACFHVESSYAKVKFAAPSRPLNSNDVIINNVVPDCGSVTAIGENTFTVPLSAFDTSIFKERCTGCNVGSKDTVIIGMNGIAINYVLEYVLCGFVSTIDGTYQFEIVMTDPCPVTSASCTSFYLPEVCIPHSGYDENAFLKIDFNFDAALVAPILTANCDGTITLYDTIILQPKVRVETIINKLLMIAVGCE